MYLRYWAAQLPGVTFLALDGSLCPDTKFPVALQEAVDFYSWLTSGQSEVTQILGFEPKDIVISGESSGANLAASLVLVLNDIRREFPAHAAPLPASVALIFPRICLRADMFPSWWLSPFEVLVSVSLQLSAGAAYIPMVKTNESNSTLSEYNPADHLTDWFKDRTVRLVDSPYLTPYSYDKFDQIADVRLKVLAFSFCPFLDEGLRLVSEWKGDKELRCLDYSFHASISFTSLSKEAKNVSKECVQMIGDCFTVS